MAVGNRTACIINGCAIEVEPDDLAFGAKKTAAVIFTDGSRRGAIGHRKDVVAKVDQHEGIVVGIAGYHLAPEFAHGDAYTRHSGDPFGRAEDAGEPVQGIDGHVVHGATAWFAVVPRRVDV